MQDIIIRGGTVVDGSGAPAYVADVAVKDGRISAIGDLGDLCAEEEVDAAGLIVAPGFIDMHAHSDFSYRYDDSGASRIYQGITTEVVGNCGETPFPAQPQFLAEAALGHNTTLEWYAPSFAAFAQKFADGKQRIATNMALMVGHCSLRAGVMGFADRPATAAELMQMQQLLQQDLADGAFGLSLGMEYAPGFFAEADELQALGAVVQAHGGMVTCHLRNEGLHLIEAIDELLAVGESSGVPVHISHLKIDNVLAHGSAKEVWEHIEEAQRRGIKVSADMYPYIASSTTLSIRCPKWSLDGGDAALLQHLQGPRRAEVVEGIRKHYFNAKRAEACLFVDDHNGLWPEIVGKTLREVAETLLDTTDYAEAAAEVLLRTKAMANCVFFVMSEADMLHFLKQDICIGSDGYAYAADAALVPGRPHPRSYGAFAEFFRLSQDKQLCSIEEAVRRMSGKNAALAGIKDRGLLKVGLVADIAVFSAADFASEATYLQPLHPARGMRQVIINGRFALKDGVQTAHRGGIILKHGIN
ncbi:MAG: amidohydrolase family protein [Firmicutes bacterium]|nr:amidohydrolase family protein [Bacillota bacterium]